MSIYDEVNAQLEDKSLNAAHIAAIRNDVPWGCWAILDDGNEIELSYNDYWVLNQNIGKLHEEHRRRMTAPVIKTNHISRQLCF